MNAGTGAFERILLTGGTGFAGGYLAPALATAYPEARRVLLHRPGEGRRAGWESLEADMLDRASIETVVREVRPDLVMHLAAQSSIGAALRAGEETWRVNFGGTLELAAACARHVPGTTFFFVSSAEVYGRSFLDGVATEDTPLRPANAYARSKAAAEAMLLDVLGPEARLVVARPFNHTGPGQDERFVLPAFAAQIADIEAGRKAPRLDTGNLAAERDFMDVGDVCEAYLALLRLAPGLPARSVFNIASGRCWRIGELAEKLRSLSTTPFEIAVDPARLRPVDIPVAAGSADKLTKATGWSPATPIEQTLQTLLDHWRQKKNRGLN